MDTFESDISSLTKCSCKSTLGAGSKLESENLICIDGETVSISLLVENPGLSMARKNGIGRWCVNSSCTNHSTCSSLHCKEWRTKSPCESNTLAVEIVLEQLTASEDPLGALLSDKTKKQVFKSMLQVTDSVESLVPIVQRIVSSLYGSTVPLPEALVEVRLWCDAWIIRCTEQMDKLHACSSALQNTFFALVSEVCERDPTSPDTRRGLAEASKLPFVSPENIQKAKEFLQETVINLRETECNEETDKKHKRWVVNPMYRKEAIPVFNAVVWPKLLSELQSGFSELRELPGLVVDRFIPPEICGLHLRVLQHLSWADFMHPLINSVKVIEEQGLNVFKENQKLGGYEQRVHIYHVTLNEVTYSLFGRRIAIVSLWTRIDLQKEQFLKGDLVLLCQKGVKMNDENSFLAVVEMFDDNTLFLSPFDILSSRPLLKSGSRFVLIRSNNFYLPTAASLTQLRIQESKMANNNARHLLRALLTGDGATAPPIYLSHNPPIEIDSCVALKDGSESAQPALGDWPCKKWSEEAEEKIRRSFDREKALLDSTQNDALQHIMRNRVAVVRGAPGTGKSFVGFKFLQMLLYNRKKLGIGPVVVMMGTHRTLESCIERIIPVAERYNTSVGLLGTIQNCELKQHAISMHCQQTEPSKVFSYIFEAILRICSWYSVNSEAESIIMNALEKHANHDMYREWCQGRNMYEGKCCKIQRDYRELRDEVSRRLCISVPDEFKCLNEMYDAVKRKQWHGKVDIIPFLKKHLPSNVEKELDHISSLLKKIFDLKEIHFHENYEINKAIVDLHNRFCYLHSVLQKDILAECLDTFEREIDKLIAFKGSMSDVKKSYTEFWRLEGMRKDYRLPSLVDMRAAEREREENTKEKGAVDVDLQQIKRKKNKSRREKRDIKNDITNWEDIIKIMFIPIPPKEERDTLVRGACCRISTARPGEERSQLISVLLQEEIYSLRERLKGLTKKKTKKKEEIDKEEADMEALELAKYAVIGGTSTAVMRSIEAIQRCGASVLIVEDAAEVLESHLLACITESMQHVVLIGDHKELTPEVNEYVLERRHNLAVSTMERMVLCGLPCVTLTMQRRMTPEISNLIKSYYRQKNVVGDVSVIIEDHPRTKNIPPPFGVCHNDGTPIRLFFLSHNGNGKKAESMSNSMMSLENIFEAKIAARIAHYLRNCNDGKNITVLTPYAGQQVALQKEMKSLGVQMRTKFVGAVAEDVFNEGVYVSTIDNYQGEEDDIIIISLVRTEGFDFLLLDNRACVALSRARSALYVIGCGALLSGASELWRHLEQTTKGQNCIGSRFPARCNRHLEQDLSFGSAAEYDAHGAHCRKQCGATLECGHACSGKCGVCSKRGFHSDCKVPRNALVCGHKSKKGCTGTVTVCNVICSFCCGHNTPCDKLSEEDRHKCSECRFRRCMKPCLWECPHGKCNKECHLPCEFETTVNNSADSSSTGCWRRCEKKLSCGHQCCGLCGERCPNICRECYKAGDENTLQAAEKVTTYMGDEELGILRTDNSAEAQSLIELPCCKAIFASKELHSLFAVKMKEKEIAALKCPHCSAIVLPNSFHHAGVFINKRLLQAAYIMDECRPVLKENTKHDVGDVIEYMRAELEFPYTEKLTVLIRGLRTMPRSRLRNFNYSLDLPNVFLRIKNLCTESGLRKQWGSLLCYHLEVLEKADRGCWENEAQITENMYALSKAALRYTIIYDGISKSDFRGSSLKMFFARILNDLVPPPSDLSKSFPHREATEDVRNFCQKIEWTMLLHQIRICYEVPLQSFNSIFRFSKHFAKKGVMPDEADFAQKVKEQINKLLTKKPGVAQ